MTVSDPELALLVAATARPAAERHRAVIAAAARAGTIDWTRFLALVDRHRIAPLAFDGLSETRAAMPAEALAVLRERAMRDRAGALQLVGVLAIVTQTLADAGIASATIKGPTLALLAFGDASLRQCRDLDVLIAPEDVERALEALGNAGFEQVFPARFAGKGGLARWKRLAKDVSLRHGPSGALVELHWRLNNNAHFVPGAVSRSRQAVTIGEATFATLGAEDLLLYVCAHGAKHHWFRLKWLADVHALLGGGDAVATARLYEHAQRYGLDVVAGQMLLLLERVYGATLPVAVMADIVGRRRPRALARFAERLLSSTHEPEERRFTTTRMITATLFYRNDRHFVARELLEMALDWPTLIAHGASRGSYVAATVGRPLLWAARKLRWSRPGG